jgi:hypothetical protein
MCRYLTCVSIRQLALLHPFLRVFTMANPKLLAALVAILYFLWDRDRCVHMCAFHSLHCWQVTVSTIELGCSTRRAAGLVRRSPHMFTVSLMKAVNVGFVRRLGEYFQNHNVQMYIAAFVLAYASYKYQLRIKKMLVRTL